jgi:hypothetical protein
VLVEHRDRIRGLYPSLRRRSSRAHERRTA